MKSMTGYGRGECTEGGFKVTTEVSSVNRKQTEINVYLPRELEPLEAQVRNEVNRVVGRGRITVKIVLHAGEGSGTAQVQINTALAQAYARELSKLARELQIPSGVTLDHLIRAPGVLQSQEVLADAEAFWPAILKAVQEALQALIKMREREGSHLCKDLKARISFIKKAAARIEEQAPAMIKRYQEQLRERIKNAGFELPLDDERLMKEVIYFADRSDISEELTRLKSHFRQFDECAKSTEPIGRTLDFLAQEINREINTIGSKAADTVISREVVGCKAELEKFREQVQNVE